MPHYLMDVFWEILKTKSNKHSNFDQHNQKIFALGCFFITIVIITNDQNINVYLKFQIYDILVTINRWFEFWGLWNFVKLSETFSLKFQWNFMSFWFYWNFLSLSCTFPRDTDRVAHFRFFPLNINLVFLFSKEKFNNLLLTCSIWNEKNNRWKFENTFSVTHLILNSPTWMHDLRKIKQ